MKRYLEAIKHKESWSIKLTESMTVATESEVIDFIRYKGLEIKHMPSRRGLIIYAE